MTTRFKISIAAGIAALSLAAAAPALLAGTAGQASPDSQDVQQRGPRRPGPMAGGPMRGPGPGFGLPLRELDLTDDQRAQLRKIREAREAEFKQAGEKVHAAREGMRALMEGDAINESAIRAKSAEVAAAEAEMAILNAKVRQESLQILTAEQQQKLKELQANRRGSGPRGGPAKQRRQRGQ